MKKVKFENGKFGVRVINTTSFLGFGWAYMDLKNLYSWHQGDKYFRDCQGSEECVDEYIKSRKKLKYKVVK